MNISKMENEPLSMSIYNACVDAGFSDCGIIALEDMAEYIAKTQERIEKIPASAGFYGVAIRDTEQLSARFPWAKSIVICLSWLGKYRYPQELQGMYAKSFFVSRDSDKSGCEYLQKQRLGQWFDEHHIQWSGDVWGLRHAAQVAGGDTPEQFSLQRKGLLAGARRFSHRPALPSVPGETPPRLPAKLQPLPEILPHRGALSPLHSEPRPLRFQPHHLCQRHHPGRYAGGAAEQLDGGLRRLPGRLSL